MLNKQAFEAEPTPYFRVIAVVSHAALRYKAIRIIPKAIKGLDIMNMRKLMLATASVALVAAPVAAQANTRAAQSSVSVSPAAFSSARSGSKVKGEEFVLAPLFLVALAAGAAAVTALIVEVTSSNGI